MYFFIRIRPTIIIAGIAMFAVFSSCEGRNLERDIKRARSTFDEGNFSEARSEFGELLKNNPDNPEINFYLGVSLQMLELYEDAIPYFTNVLSLDPQADNAAFDRANCWYGLARYDKALKDYELVLEISPQRYAVYNPLSHMRFLTGDTAGACEALQIAKKYYADRDFDPRIIEACQ